MTNDEFGKLIDIVASCPPELSSARDKLNRTYLLRDDICHMLVTTRTGLKSENELPPEVTAFLERVACGAAPVTKMLDAEIKRLQLKIKSLEARHD